MEDNFKTKHRLLQGRSTEYFAMIHMPTLSRRVCGTQFRIKTQVWLSQNLVLPFAKHEMGKLHHLSMSVYRNLD